MKEDKKLEKLELQSVDTVRENIDKLLELFPQVATESYDNKKTIDFEKLKELLSDNIIDDSDNERYDFTWVGKRSSQIEANIPTNKTLRPCVDESKDFNTTENLYIEGDNLQVLKLLKKHYTNKIKMIYIDPPYNTGKDFIYKDNFNMSKEEYDKLSGKFDDDGNRMIVNNKEYGRYHSAWCSMIYSRLLVAKSLLTNDGVIFISIDDNEVANLRKICDEIFGEGNFVGQIAQRRFNSQANIGMFSKVKDYILIYTKNYSSLNLGRLPLSETAKKEYQYRDENGIYARRPCIDSVRGRYKYEVICPNSNVLKDKWMISEEEFNELNSKNLIHWPANGGNPMQKIYLKDALKKGQIACDFWGSEYGNNKVSVEEIKLLFGFRIFDFPKPTLLLKNLINLGICKSLDTSKHNTYILDFFSGSATTAHAVMQLNAEDGGNRKFIMVQVPELTDEKSESYKAGYKNICEIGKERIRRAGKQIKDNDPIGTQDLDTGFRVFKLDTTNKHDIQYEPNKIYHENIEKFVSVFKEDRSHLDLFFDCILNWGLPLNLPYKVENIDGYNVYNYNDGDLLGLFDENINKSILEKIANRKPKRIVFIESNFKDNDNSDSLKGNLLENFKMWLDMDDKSVMDMVKVI